MVFGKKTWSHSARRVCIHFSGNLLHVSAKILNFAANYSDSRKNMNNELFLYMKTFIYVLLLLCSGSVVAQDHFSISVTPGEFTIEKALQEARLRQLHDIGDCKSPQTAVLRLQAALARPTVSNRTALTECSRIALRPMMRAWPKKTSIFRSNSRLSG